MVPWSPRCLPHGSHGVPQVCVSHDGPRNLERDGVCGVTSVTLGQSHRTRQHIRLPYCTPYTAHSTLHTAHYCTLHTTYCTPHTALCSHVPSRVCHHLSKTRESFLKQNHEKIDPACRHYRTITHPDWEIYCTNYEKTDFRPATKSKFESHHKTKSGGRLEERFIFRWLAFICSLW